MNARTPDMLAAELGYSRSQIYAMIKRNEIGYVRRPGGRSADADPRRHQERGRCMAAKSYDDVIQLVFWSFDVE